MSGAPLILVVEDNPRNLKLPATCSSTRLPHARGRDRRGRRRARPRAPSRRSSSWTSSCRASTASRRSRRLRGRPATAGDPGRRAHRVRDEGRPRAVPRRRVRRLPREADRRPRVPRPGRAALAADAATEARGMSDAGTILVVDDLPQNLRLLEAVLAPRGYASCRRRPGSEALEPVAGEPRRPRAARHPDARDGRLRGVPRGCARTRRRSFLPGRHGHGERRPGEGRGARGRRRRLHHQAVRPGRAAGAGALAGAGQALPRHDRGAGGRAREWNRELEQRVARAGRRARAARPAAALPLAADRRARRRLRRRVVPREPPARDHGRLLRPARLHRVRRDGRAGGGDGGARASTTRRSATSSTATRARSSTSPATGSWSSSTTRCRARTRPERAVRMALEMRDRVGELAEGWRRQGHDLGFGVGIAQGYATLGRIGFEGRSDYAAIGTVTNLAARLCAAAAAGPDPHQPARARRPTRTSSSPTRSGELSCAASRGRSRPTRSSGSTRRGPRA